jgi:hypothetical protein
MISESYLSARSCGCGFGSSPPSMASAAPHTGKRRRQLQLWLRRLASGPHAAIHAACLLAVWRSGCTSRLTLACGMTAIAGLLAPCTAVPRLLTHAALYAHIAL